MPVTTRRRTAWASGLVAAGVGAAMLAPASAALADPPQLTSPASVTSPAVTPGVGPVSVSIMMPLTVTTPTTTGLLSVADLETATGMFGELTRQLDAVAGTTATIGVDPMILASIRALGSAAPASATAWLARLESVTNEVFLLAYGDADVAAAARTQTLDALTPSGFEFALDPNNFAPTQATADETATVTPTPSPSATAGDTEPELPTATELLFWSSTLPVIAWPADGSVGASDVAPLAGAGYSHIVVDSGSLSAASTPLVELDAATGIVSDAPLSAQLRAASASVVETEQAASTGALWTSLDAVAASAPGRGLVLTLDRGADVTGLSATLATLATNPNVRLSPLSAILATSPAPAQIVASAPNTARDATFAAMVQNVAQEATFSAVLTVPAQLTDTRRLERIALYGLAWNAVPTDWSDAAIAFVERSEAIVSSVSIERGSDLVLLARNTDFRVTVQNALEFPVTVRVDIASQSPILQTSGSSSVELVVEPHSSNVAKIPVEAAANGNVLVFSSISALDGTPIDSGYSKVSVQAEWENIGTAAVATVLVVIVVIGFLRIWFRRRKPEADAEAADAAAADAAPADTEASRD